MSSVSARAFVTFADVTKANENATVGGRLDYRGTAGDFDIVVSGTDATAKSTDALPWLKDAVITADTRYRGVLPILRRLRYDREDMSYMSLVAEAHLDATGPL